MRFDLSFVNLIVGSDDILYARAGDSFRDEKWR